MMGRRRFAPKLYYQLSLDQLIPKDHLLRHIAETIDFTFVYHLAQPYYSHTGQPSVDPVIVFKTLLVGYLFGITSERRLMAEIQVNMAYRWFLGYDLDEPIPNHSVLSKARARFGMEVFEMFFKQSIEMCREAGLLSEGPVYVDTTLVQAAASMDSLVRRDETIKPPLTIQEYVRRLYTENNPTPQEGEPSFERSTSDTMVPPRYRKVRPDGHRRKANNELISRTDPEATIVSRRGFDLHLAYKAHVAVSGRSGQVVTAAVATTGAKADEHLLDEMISYHNRLTGVSVREVVADAKYGTIANYTLLHNAGMTAFIPPRQRILGPRGIWGKARFRYLEEEDVFLCPTGIPMKRFANRASTHRISYRVEKGACVGCHFREQCTPSGKDRTISRFFDQKLVDEAKERLSSPLGQELIKQRKVRVEGVFALAKELHGLRRTRFMGRWKVQIQLWLTAAAMNIKKALRELRKIAAMADRSLPTILKSLVGAAEDIAVSIQSILFHFRHHFGNSPR